MPPKSLWDSDPPTRAPEMSRCTLHQARAAGKKSILLPLILNENGSQIERISSAS